MIISNIAFGISIFALFMSSINMGSNIARIRYLSPNSKYSHLSMKEIQRRIRIFTFVFAVIFSTLLLGLTVLFWLIIFRL